MCCGGFHHEPRTPCVCSVATEMPLGTGAGAEGLVLETLLPPLPCALGREIILFS